MTEPTPIPLVFQPGVQRDGTTLSSTGCVSAKWTRWQRQMPRKIGGYRSISKYVQGPPRSLFGYAQDDLAYLHAGSAARLERFTIDRDLSPSIISDRTPAGLTASADNVWQFDADTATAGSLLLTAQVAPNLTNIANSAGGQLFTGPMFSTAALTAVTVPGTYSATGGILALHPYSVAFGNDGFVMWSADPTDYTAAGAGNAYVTAQKIVRGMALRAGGGNSPAALFWSLDSLVRATYVGGAPTFQFDTLTAQSSILSPNSVIEYDGIYYWLGTDRMLMFNGVVREIPNDCSINFFYDNLNNEHAQKVFAFKVPRFGEIWWCFPFGDSTEPNWAIIYNVREQSWYDTELPNSGRCAGTFVPATRRPVLCGVDPQDYTAAAVAISAAGAGYVVGNTLEVAGGTSTIPVELTVATVGGGGNITAVSISNAGSYTVTPTNPVSVTGGAGAGATFTLTFVAPYKLWVHETGTNEVDGSEQRPIESTFETSKFTPSMNVQLAQTPVSNALQVSALEPDFIQSGDMTVTVTGQANARAPTVTSETMTFGEDTQLVNLKAQRRQMRFIFTSNVIDGDYQMGSCLLHLRLGDGRKVS